MLVLAVAMGATSVYLARDWLQRQGQSSDAAAKPSIELTTVVVAKLPMNFGDSVTSEYLREVEWPAATVPENSFRTVEELIKPGEERVVLRSIQINEPVLLSKLSGAGGKATLSTILDKDMRAITIRVNDVNGVAGFVLPGDRVDVLLTREENRASRTKNPITDILLQNVKVLGIDQKANDNEDQPKVVRAVTLEVEPFDAQKLALAVTVGSLALALRHEANADADYTRTVRVSDLKARILVDDTKAEKVATTAGEGAAPAKKKKKKRYVTPVSPFSNVTVVRGVDTSTSKVLKDKDKAAQAAKASASKTATSKPAITDDLEVIDIDDGPKIIVPQG
jgi:pilus assembly protein CpaB